MAYTNLSLNNQYAIGGCNVFPNRNAPYATLNIKNTKSRADQKQARKVQALSTQPKRYASLLKSRNPAKRKMYQKMVANILRHENDQSILASEHGAFPSLPKASVAGRRFPARGLTVVPRAKRAKSARLDEPLQNVFMPTKFQRLTDASITTPTLILSGREQPLGGTEGTPEMYHIPLYLPNAAYGGTAERYW